MVSRIFNLGSINIDHVYRVPAFVRPGETLAATAYARGAGGKGFNQSVALARAGAAVVHIGAIGPEGVWLRDYLSHDNVDTGALAILDEPTGHAIIQVDRNGQNAIVLAAGANHAIPQGHVQKALQGASSGDWFLCQNETNDVGAALEAAKAAGLKCCFNPAPMSEAVQDYPIHCVDWLILNETEGADLSGASEPKEIIHHLLARWPHLQVVLTLGGDGAVFGQSAERLRVSACRVEPVDTTAAGDTFVGYLLASLAGGQPIKAAMERASRAAALCVTRPGAADAIPTAVEVESFSETVSR